jgi:hypothetical protein
MNSSVNPETEALVLVANNLILDTMRNEDIARLKAPVPQGDYFVSERAFEQALGVDVPNCRSLAEEIFSDFDPQFHGVNWWISLPEMERILISDYLYQVVTSINTNLVEAKLHLLELRDAREGSNQRIADAVKVDDRGNLSVKLPPHISAYDHLPGRLQELHVAGFLRSIGSCLDCLGATVIGVLGLSTKLRKSDINKAEQTMSRIDKSSGAGAQIQSTFYDFFMDLKRVSGPNDWVEWADQLRNVFVHRGRRIIYHMLSQRKPVLLNEAGKPILRSNETVHLPKYPDRSEIEAFIENDVALNEDGTVTLEGIIESTRALLDNSCEKLQEIWKTRRASPAIIDQPITQWSDSAKQCLFQGYSSSAKPLDMSMLVSNPRVRFRVRTGAVDDAQRGLWRGSRFET